MSDPTPTAPTDGSTNNPTAGGDPQNQSATDWQAKFEAQQKVNRDLETKFNGLRDQQAAQTQAFAQALGIKPEEGTPDVAVLAATVQTLQEQFTQTQHANRVLTVAAEHNITDPKRIETLGRITDEATLRDVAAQFAQSPGSDNPSTTPGPRPDLTQGAQGTPATGDPATDFQKFLGGQLAGR
jgi:hypothetical protein